MEYKSTTLFFKEGGSDKVYQASIEKRDAGYMVNFAFGRRGAALKAGTKTAAPVSLEAAIAIYDKLVQEKTAKGYSPGEDGTPFVGSELAGRASGIFCQLLSNAPLDLSAYIENPEWGAMEKFDGDRRLVRVDSETGQVEGINRRGLIVPLPEPLAQAALRVGRHITASGKVVFDGELIGESLVVFDLAHGEGASLSETAADAPESRPLQDHPFETRYRALENAIGRHLAENAADQLILRLAPLALSTSEKDALAQDVKGRNGEGIVFRQRNAPYRSGRCDHALKVKFIETASVIAGPVNGSKRSVSMLVHDADGKLVPCGNVTVLPNFELPVQGAVLEVAYLYAYRESGKLYQPVYRGERNDITIEECTLSQFKYRPEPNSNRSGNE